ASSESVIGKTVIRGRIDDSSVISKFYYIIPTSSQKSAIDEETYTFNSEGWKDINSVIKSDGSSQNDYSNRSSMMWEIPFNSSSFKTQLTDSTSTISDLSLIEYASAITGSGESASLTYAESTEIESSVTGKKCVYVPLYFYSEDETGIGKVTKTKILVDPYAGIPQIEVISPEEFSKTGGNLNFQGSASDDAGDLEKVLMTKLEFSYTDATSSTINNVNDWEVLSQANLAGNNVVTKGRLNDDGSITAVGKASWKISINANAISTEKDIKIARATFVAYDSNGTPSSFQLSSLADDPSKALVTNIFVDKNAPKLSNIQLVQYETAPTDAASLASAVPSLSRSYSAGMYISHSTGNGNWYLKATITDDASVEGFTITSGNSYISLSGKAEKDGALTGGIIVSGLGEKTCTFIIPLSTDSNEITQFYPTIELDDGQHTDVTQNLSFFVDNTPPSLYDRDDNADTELAHGDNLRLKSNGLVVGSENVVENSDGSYTFGDMLKEAGSGLAYVAFYFKKTASTSNNTNRVYSPMFNTENDNVAVIAAEKTVNSIYINSEGLPALVKEVTRSASNKLSFTGLSDNKFINNKKWQTNATSFGLVKIGGSYHKITDITGDVATIADEVPVNYTEAEFIYAMLVDHQIAEGFDSSSDTGVSNDDGDGLVEMVKQTGSSYKWTASIYSDNIPDGPAEIHVVAFDEAGNSNSGYVKTSIQNNRPRIARVYLATDLNG
ncbi:MAG: hypothetical protein K5873_01925, partial [Treponema sp.]|nr:hypothetical protein [Treponema sp.]